MLRTYLAEHLPLESLLDLGCGIYPQDVLTTRRHVGVEVYEPYATRAKAKGIEVVLMDLNDQPLPFRDGSFDVVWMADVVEHLEKEAGCRLFAEAIRIASLGVVIRSPHGFERQEGDAWGLGGDEWQRHRSGWTPDEFDPEAVWHVPSGVIKKGAAPWFQAFVRTGT